MASSLDQPNDEEHPKINLSVAASTAARVQLRPFVQQFCKQHTHDRSFFHHSGCQIPKIGEEGFGNRGFFAQEWSCLLAKNVTKMAAKT